MQGSKEKIALFDFCETLVSFQTADAFVRFVGEATGSARVSRMLRIHHFLDRKGIIGRLYKLFPESSPGKRLVARGLKGFREDALDELAGRYYAQRLRPALIPEVVGRLRSLQRDGWRIVLVSGAYDSYLRFFAREYGIAQDDILATCGEGADEEAFNAYLAENHVSRQMYDRMSRADYLFNGIYTKLYGENGASVSEADALAYLAENAYLSAGHILFSTVDDTYAPLDEETVAKKLEQAETVSAELRAIEDDAARAARFAELKAQYCEDPGREVYPEGYVFTPGTMVEEFEDAVNALADYEVSEPVLSAFGYHVIMRLPLSADATVSVSNDGTALTARSLYANEKFNEEMTARIESSDLTLRDDVAAIRLTDYLE